jgi:hypothetical protein
MFKEITPLWARAKLFSQAHNLLHQYELTGEIFPLDQQKLTGEMVNVKKIHPFGRVTPADRTARDESYGCGQHSYFFSLLRPL